MAPLSAIADRSNLQSRILSGAVLAPLVILLVYFGGIPFMIGLFGAAAIGLLEWMRLVTGKLQPWSVVVLAAVPIAYLLSGGAAAIGVMGLAALAADLVVRAQRGNSLLAAFGVPYLGLAVLSLAWLRDTSSGGWPLVLFVFLVVWASDIGGYVVGRALGGPKLVPGISPNKTWAGFGGGLFFSACIALGWTATMPMATRPAEAAVIAVGLSLVGQGGDLFESVMKRRFGVKDSGQLIPGHGGMLDRIDALLWVAPAFAALHLFGLTKGVLS